MNTILELDVLFIGEKMKKLISIFIFCIALTGCSNNTEDDKIQVITTFYPYQLAANQIGKDAIDVSSIYPEDSEAHSYEMTPKQSIQIQDADLVIITSKQEDSKIYKILEDNPNLLILDEGDNAKAHAWMSPKQMIGAIKKIENRLIEINKDNEANFTNNANELVSALQKNDQDYSEFAKDYKKPIIATHDAYGALTNDYNMQFDTLFGQHHDDEPTANEISKTIDQIKKYDIKTIFVEQDDISNKILHQIADETGVDVQTLFTLESKSSVKDFNSLSEFYNYNLQMFKLGQE